MGRKIKKMKKSDLQIREQRPEVGNQLAFAFMRKIRVEKKKGRPTNGSPTNGQSEITDRETSETQLDLPF